MSSFVGPGIITYTAGAAWSGVYPTANPIGIGDIIDCIHVAEGTYSEDGTLVAKDTTNRLKTVHTLPINSYPPYLFGHKRISIYASKENTWHLLGTFEQSISGTTGGPPLVYNFLDLFSGSAMGYPDNTEEFFYTSLSPWSISFNGGIFSNAANGTTGAYLMASIEDCIEPGTVLVSDNSTPVVKTITVHNGGVASTTYAVTPNNQSMMSITANGTGTLAAGASVAVELTIDPTSFGDGIHDCYLLLTDSSFEGGTPPPVVEIWPLSNFKIHKNTIPVYRYAGTSGSHSLKMSSNDVVYNLLSATDGCTLAYVCRLSPNWNGSWLANNRLVANQYHQQMRFRDLSIPAQGIWNPGADHPEDFNTPTNPPDWEDCKYHVVIISTKAGVFKVRFDNTEMIYGSPSEKYSWNAGDSVETVGTTSEPIGLYTHIDVSYFLVFDKAITGDAELTQLYNDLRFGGQAAAESTSRYTDETETASATLVNGWRNNEASNTQSPFVGSVTLTASSGTSAYELGFVGTDVWSEPSVVEPEDQTITIDISSIPTNSVIHDIVPTVIYDQVLSVGVINGSTIGDRLPLVIPSLLNIGGVVMSTGVPVEGARVFVINASTESLEAIVLTDVEGAWSHLASNGDEYAVFPDVDTAGTHSTDYPISSIIVE